MCTRYVLLQEHLRAILRRLGLDEDTGYVTRYNIAPSSRLPAVRATPKREHATLRWGLVPSWAKEDVGFKMVNARVETLAAKPAFRDALRKRRCVIPATGFYEWQTVGRTKQPWLVRRRDEQPFAFAGLWDEWLDRGTGELHPTFTIITTEPNSLMANIHNRMPVILPTRSAEQAWLDDGLGMAAHQQLLVPYDAAAMQEYVVSKRVNSPANNDAEVLAAA